VIEMRQVAASATTDPVGMRSSGGALDLPRRAGPALPGERPELSHRQREVLQLLGEGVQAREIAARLGLAEPTVRNHIRIVLRKLGCHSQLEAVAVAARLDLLRR
jgi:DNA-binding CsgD family transcriptional regulator